MQRIELVNNEIYHVVSRAVGDSVIFKDKNDYYRGAFSLYEFNNRNPVDIWLRRQQRKEEKAVEKLNSLEGRTFQTVPDRDLLIEILAFCFMPNHIHLLMRQLKDNGISQFMQKVGTGYALYFNKKHSRKGHLFNKFKAVHVITQEQLKNVFVYIHTNPISLIEPGFKERGIKNSKRITKFLEKEYRWSSFFDYIGKKNFPSITTRDFLLRVMSGEDGCGDAIKNWIIYKEELGKLFDDVALE